jgi:hypothetical protein
MKVTAPQLELRPCSEVFNLFGERSIDGARAIAELAEASKREREARAWQEKMQRKLSECPGFLGCSTVGEQSPCRVTIQPGAGDEAVTFLKRRFHLGPVVWEKGIGLTIEVVPRRKGMTKAVARNRLAPIEQFQFGFEKRTP